MNKKIEQNNPQCLSVIIFRRCETFARGFRATGQHTQTSSHNSVPCPANACRDEQRARRRQKIRELWMRRWCWPRVRHTPAAEACPVHKVTALKRITRSARKRPPHSARGHKHGPRAPRPVSGCGEPSHGCELASDDGNANGVGDNEDDELPQRRCCCCYHRHAARLRQR